MLLDYLREIPDHRRGQGRRYDLARVLRVAILALLSGTNSYRTIHTFAKVHFERLRITFGLRWRQAPSYSRTRTIIQGVNGEALESAFRGYSAALAAGLPEGMEYLSCDGKELRGSFDHMEDKRAAQLLSVFATDNRLILAHREIPEKTNEIRDGTFGEDDSRIRKNPAILARCRSFVSNILRVNNQDTVHNQRFALALEFNQLPALHGIS